MRKLSVLTALFITISLSSIVCCAAESESAGCPPAITTPTVEKRPCRKRKQPTSSLMDEFQTPPMLPHPNVSMNIPPLSSLTLQGNVIPDHHALLVHQLIGQNTNLVERINTSHRLIALLFQRVTALETTIAKNHSLHNPFVDAGNEEMKKVINHLNFLLLILYLLINLLPLVIFFIPTHDK
jgi:hypothetical protein